MNIYDAIGNKIQNEMEFTVTKIKKIIDEGDITKEKLNDVTNLMIILSNLNQALALSKTIKPTKEEESKT